MSDFNFIIQVQPDNSSLFLDYKKSLELWANDTKIVKNFIIEDKLSTKEAYWNIHLSTNNIQETYESLKSVITSESNMSDCHTTIVVACGNNGWDDYQEFYNNTPKNKKFKIK